MWWRIWCYGEGKCELWALSPKLYILLTRKFLKNNCISVIFFIYSKLTIIFFYSFELYLLCQRAILVLIYWRSSLLHLCRHSDWIWMMRISKTRHTEWRGCLCVRPVSDSSSRSPRWRHSQMIRETVTIVSSWSRILPWDHYVSITFSLSLDFLISPIYLQTRYSDSVNLPDLWVDEQVDHRHRKDWRCLSITISNRYLARKMWRSWWVQSTFVWR